MTELTTRLRQHEITLMHKAAAEIDRLLALLQTINIELSALVVTPSAPDFGPATRNCNPADAACLLLALDAAREGPEQTSPSETEK